MHIPVSLIEVLRLGTRLVVEVPASGQSAQVFDKGWYIQKKLRR